jgi:hypothetical protein
MQMGLFVSAFLLALLALLGTKVHKYLAPARDLLVDADEVVYERLCCL